LHLSIDNDGAVQSVNFRGGETSARRLRYILRRRHLEEQRFGDFVLPHGYEWMVARNRTIQPILRSEIISATPTTAVDLRDRMKNNADGAEPSVVSRARHLVCIANGAVNSAVRSGTAREQTGLDVTNVARIALSAYCVGPTGSRGERRRGS